MNNVSFDNTDTPAISLMCKRHDYEYNSATGTFVTGDWVISEKKQRELLGQVIESAEKEWEFNSSDVCSISHYKKANENKTKDNNKGSIVDRSVLGAVKYTPMFGLGYGLPIVKVYAQYFGGQCKIQSIDGYGTDAYLYLNNLQSSNVRVI